MVIRKTAEPAGRQQPDSSRLWNGSDTEEADTGIQSVGAQLPVRKQQRWALVSDIQPSPKEQKSRTQVAEDRIRKSESSKKETETTGK